MGAILLSTFYTSNRRAIMSQKGAFVPKKGYFFTQNNLSVSMIRAAVCKSWPRPVGPIASVLIKIMETLRYEANRSIIERKWNIWDHFLTLEWTPIFKSHFSFSIFSMTLIMTKKLQILAVLLSLIYTFYKKLVYKKLVDKKLGLWCANN